MWARKRLSCWTNDRHCRSAPWISRALGLWEPNVGGFGGKTWGLGKTSGLCLSAVQPMPFGHGPDVSRTGIVSKAVMWVLHGRSLPSIQKNQKERCLLAGSNLPAQRGQYALIECCTREWEMQVAVVIRHSCRPGLTTLTPGGSALLSDEPLKRCRVRVEEGLEATIISAFVCFRALRR